MWGEVGFPGLICHDAARHTWAVEKKRRDVYPKNKFTVGFAARTIPFHR